jgi:glycosyltransferase involved in cell wall biosynthesis
MVQITGVQRYTDEIVSRLRGRVDIISPKFEAQGLKGHLWEQASLPFIVGSNLLWSPANTGPLSIRNQVVSILDLSVLEHPEWFAPNFARWYRFMLPRLAKRVRKILTISEFSRDRIVENCHVENDKIVVTHLAAGQRFYPKQKDEIDNVRKELNIPSGRYILALGSLEPRKNLNRLLEAWIHIQPNLPDDLWLVIAGARGKSLVFRDVNIKDLPVHVYLSGYVPEDRLPYLYSGAIIFVYPSLYEGFGLPPLEAMACGTPVIVSNSSSLPEVVGNAGIFINPLDFESIADALEHVVKNEELRLSLGKKSLQQANMFSWDKTTELTWKVLLDNAGSSL